MSTKFLIYWENINGYSSKRTIVILRHWFNTSVNKKGVSLTFDSTSHRLSFLQRIYSREPKYYRMKPRDQGGFGPQLLKNYIDWVRLELTT